MTERMRARRSGKQAGARAGGWQAIAGTGPPAWDEALDHSSLYCLREVTLTGARRV